VDDDIVTRLRDTAYEVDVCWEAAEEIERLRTAGDALAEHLHAWVIGGEDVFSDDVDALAAWGDARRER
jgi:hypothetical protein